MTEEFKDNVAGDDLTEVVPRPQFLTQPEQTIKGGDNPDELKTVGVEFLPCSGLDVRTDETVVDPKVARESYNFMIDSGALVTRGGSWTWEPPSGATFIKAFYYVRLINGDEYDVCAYTYNSSTVRIAARKKESWSWVSYTIPTGVTLSLTAQGKFIQFKDTIYYFESDQIPLMLSLLSNSLITKCYNVGTKNANEVMLISDCEDFTNWSLSYTGPYHMQPSINSMFDYNITHFVLGETSIIFQAVGASDQATLTYTPASAIPLTTFSDGSSTTNQDYFAFSLYAWNRRDVKAFYVRVYVGANSWFDYCICDYVTGNLTDGSHIESVWNNIVNTFNYRTPHTIWHTEEKDAKLFNFKLRMSGFIPGGSSPPANSMNTYSITSIAFYMETKAAISAQYINVTLDYIRLQKTEPVPYVDGVSISEFENDGWETVVGSTGTVKFDHLHPISGNCSLEIPASSTAYKVWTGMGLNLSKSYTGRTISARDRISLRAYGECLIGGLLRIELQDISFRKATKVFWASGKMFSSGEQSHPLWSFSYSTGNFSTFNWLRITKINIVNLSTARTIWVDNLHLELAKLSKSVAMFEAVDLRLAQLTGDIAKDVIDTALKAVGVSGGEIADTDWGDVFEDTMKFLRYHSQGAGSLLYPDEKNFEKLWSTCSMTLSTAPNESTVNLNASAIFSEEDDDRIEGFRVTWARHSVLGVLDLSKYNAVYIPISGYSDILGTDKFRIWVKVKGASNLCKIKFRLILGDFVAPLAGAFFDVFGHRTEFYEYQVMGQQICSERNEKLLNAYGVKETTSIPINIPGLGKVNLNQDTISKEVYERLGVDIPEVNLDEDSVETVLEWQKNDMVRHGSNSGYDWTDVIGYSIEVVDYGNEHCSVSFDNWSIHSCGNLKGEYFYKTTIMNSYGVEGEASDLSERVNANGDYVSVRNLPVGGTTIDRRSLCLYRMGGTSSEFKLVDVINSSLVDQYTDNITDEDLGKILDEGFQVPDKVATATVCGNNVVYANFTDRVSTRKFPSRVALSDPFVPEKIRLEKVVDVRPWDGQEITGVVYPYNYLTILKTNSVWTLDLQTLEPQLRWEGVGCIAPQSIGVWNDKVYFLSGRGPVSFDGNQVDTMLSLKVQPLFNPRMTKAVGFCVDNYYFVFYQSDSEDVTNPYENYACLYIPTGQWTQGRICKSGGYVDVSAAFVYLMPTTLDKFYCFLGTGNGKIFQFLLPTAETDNHDGAGGQAIVTVYRTPDVDCGAMEQEKVLSKIFMRSKKTGSSTSMYSVVPYCEQVAASYNGVAVTKIAGVFEATYKTVKLGFSQGARGYVQGVGLSFSGPVSVSGLKAMYQVLKEH